MPLVPFARRAREIVGDTGLFGDISILDRLDDFRKRIVRALLAVAGGALVGFAFIDRIVGFLLAPIRRVLPPDTRLIYTQPGEAFGFYVQIALLSGVVFAMPFIMYQLWRLIAPLVPVTARRFAAPFIGFTTVGFVAGAAFTHYIAFPYMMAFFATFNTPDLLFRPRLDARSVYSSRSVGSNGDAFPNTQAMPMLRRYRATIGAANIVCVTMSPVGVMTAAATKISRNA